MLKFTAKLIALTKKEIRKKYRELRLHLSADEVDSKSVAIANRLLLLPLWHLEYFHVFLPIPHNNEVNTEFILHVLAGKDKFVVVSKSDFKNSVMNHFLLTENTRLLPNHLGIPEPVSGESVPASTIQVVFVPLLAFDKTGQRVGYGKGFYDRFLSECDPQTLKVGLSFFGPEEEISDVSKFDIPLDFVATPEAVYKF